MTSHLDSEFDPPRDPLAVTTGFEHALGRVAWAQAQGLDDRSEAVLRALAAFDAFDTAEAAVQVEEITEIEEFVEEVELDDPDSAAERFVEVHGQTAERRAQADTIVLSGPDVKRRIRYKQSVSVGQVSQQLFADVRQLFQIGDREGALISLERLIVLAPLNPAIEGFLDQNEDRLLQYYEKAFGPWSRALRVRADGPRMPDGFFSVQKVAAVVQWLDGKRPLEVVFERAELRKIECCAVVSQLVRSNAIDLSI